MLLKMPKYITEKFRNFFWWGKFWWKNFDRDISDEGNYSKE